jgi:aminoglycoside phosphotransferase (APT) family kinase protein
MPEMGLPKITAFVEKNLPSIHTPRQTFLHDDYHPGNLIIQDKKLSGIIDFNRYDWGDPIHDFVKLGYFSRAVSIPFSAGQVDGYHGGSPPPEFWQRYSLYCAMTLVADVLWSALYEEQGGVAGEMNRALQRDSMVIADHDQFTSAVPGWYRNYQRPETVRSLWSGENL